MGKLINYLLGYYLIAIEYGQIFWMYGSQLLIG
jgi:hypothetical protein